MKKIVPLCLFLLLLSCLFSMNAFADKIQLPAGLEYGMSIEEAQQVSKYKRNIAESIIKVEIDKMGFEQEYLSGTATVGGNEATVRVLFDKNGLKQIAYRFKLPKMTNNEDADTQAFEACYFQIEDSLIDRYGEKMTEGTKHMYSPVTVITDRVETMTKMYDYIRVSLDSDDYGALESTRFVLDDKAGCYYIDHTGYLCSVDYSMFEYTNELTYTYYDTIPSDEKNPDTSVGF